MAVCTKCGTVMHEDDVNNHTCLEADIPKKGEPITLEARVASKVEAEVLKASVKPIEEPIV